MLVFLPSYGILAYTDIQREDTDTELTGLYSNLSRFGNRE